MPRLIPALVALLLVLALVARPAEAAPTVFKVKPSGQAVILLTDGDDDLVLESVGVDHLDYSLRDSAGNVTAEGSLTGLNGNVLVRTRGGDDAVSVGPAGLRVGNVIEIVTDGGDDTVELHDLETGSEVHVSMGSGTDHLIADFAAATPRNAFLFMGGGGDRIDVRNGDFEGFFHVVTGTGPDTVVTSGNTIGREYRLRTGAGPDTWTSTNDDFHGRVRVVSQGGDDLLTVEDAVVRAGASIAAGAGADRVQLLRGTYAGSVVVDGGFGAHDVITFGQPITFDPEPEVIRFESERG